MNDYLVFPLLLLITYYILSSLRALERLLENGSSVCAIVLFCFVWDCFGNFEVCIFVEFELLTKKLGMMDLSFQWESAESTNTVGAGCVIDCINIV